MSQKPCPRHRPPPLRPPRSPRHQPVPSPMTTSRLAILLAIMLGGLSSVFLLPKQLGFMPEGIELALPESLGEWWGQDVEVTQHEHEVLGADTEFARKQ